MKKRWVRLLTLVGLVAFIFSNGSGEIEEVRVGFNTSTPTPTITPTLTPTITPTLTPTMTPSLTVTPEPTPTMMPAPEGVPEDSVALAQGIWYLEQEFTADDIEEINPVLYDILRIKANYVQHLHFVTFHVPSLCGEFVVTGRQPNGIYQFTVEPTTRFAARNDLDIAFNGGNFMGYLGNDLDGYKIRVADTKSGDLFIASDGDIINENGNPVKTVFFSTDNQISFFAPIGEVDDAIPGKNGILEIIDDVPTILIRSGDGSAHPRTAVGLSADGDYFYVVIAEGRLPGHAEGLYQTELADIFLTFLNAAEAINFDGGGSTTFVQKSAATMAELSDVGTISLLGVLQGRVGQEGLSPYLYEITNHLPEHEREVIGRAVGTNFGFRLC